MTIVDRIGEAAVYDQLAEECCELAQAALKMSRELTGVNPTTKNMDELMANLIEELTDVKVCMECLGLYTDDTIEELKLARWHARLDEVQYGGLVSEEG
jgi:NTP pyrophosphatase (non-canonical NTP hydrolase)